MDFEDLKLRIQEWISIDSNKKLLNKLAFILIIAAYLLPHGLSEFLFWLAIFIAIFLTYSEYKYGK